MKEFEIITIANNNQYVTLRYLGNDGTRYGEIFVLEEQQSDIDFKQLANEVRELGYSIATEMIASLVYKDAQSPTKCKAASFLEELNQKDYIFKKNQPVIYAMTRNDLFNQLTKLNYLPLRSAITDMQQEIK